MYICVLVNGGEDTSGLDDVVSANGTPRDVRGVLLGEDRDGLALNDELAILGLDGTLVASVDGVVLEHVDLFQGISVRLRAAIGDRAVTYHVVKVDEGAVWSIC